MGVKKGIYYPYVKRLLDFGLSLIALIILSPVILIIAILVRAKLGSLVIFKQKRPGYNEKIFTMYKFRTMTHKKDDKGFLLPDDGRLTKFGKFLRSTSIDELPELWNILRGDMSLVGPRPQLIKDMVFMTPEQRKRHSVLPGLTGLAQVNGRNRITWEEKLSLDLKYIENITLFEDIKIIIKTVKNVFIRDGINSEGMATCEDFGDYLLKNGKIDENSFNAGIKESEQISILG